MGKGEIKSWKRYLENAVCSFSEKYNGKPTSHLKLSDFITLRTIGVGSFSRVLLVKRIADGLYYAIKILEKEKIISSHQLEHTLNEKRILLAIDFEFIVKMIGFFKDNSYLYMVMPYIPGGEIFTVLRKHRRFLEDTCRFFAAQVVLALEYLHNLRLVYRDLKPENLLIDVDGYIKVADLGFCKRIKTRTYTVCGTPEYFAPEIVHLQGYGFAVDWWCFGVLVYEFSVGKSPFFSNEPAEMFRSIVVAGYDSTKLESDNLKDLVKKLLQVNPSKRLGNLGSGAAGVRNHPWFKKTAWLDVLNKKVRAPFRPQLSGPGDTSLFGKYDHVQLKTATKPLFQKEFEDF